MMAGAWLVAGGWCLHIAFPIKLIVPCKNGRYEIRMTNYERTHRVQRRRNDALNMAGTIAFVFFLLFRPAEFLL
jgi:hypothetical protein